MTIPTPAHLGGSHVTQVDVYTFLPDIWERLITHYKISSVLDVGCGSGFSTAWFVERGLRALGIEADPACLAARRCDTIFNHDFTTGPFVPVEKWDLAWTAEFVEHVEEQFIPNWMAALKRCRYVAMTFATPGQGGHHHVCERPEQFWLDQFTAAGFDHVIEETEHMRATSKGETWGRRTLTFFVNRA